MPVPSFDGTRSLTDQLRYYILHELAVMPGRSLAEETRLFESLLDSTSVLALVAYLEETFQIEVRDSEIVPANFSTLRQLTGFVERKLAAAPAQLAANS
jgi:acyl carrier protein